MGSFLILSLALWGSTFAFPQATSFSNSTKPTITVTTLKSSPSCGPCGIAFDPQIFIWNTASSSFTYNQTIATQIIIIDNNTTNATSTSSIHNSVTLSSNDGEYNRDGTATTTFTLWERYNGVTSTSITTITSPTPYILWFDEYAVVGPTLETNGGYVSCVTAVPNTFTSLPFYPTYRPTGTVLQYILDEAGDDPQAPQALLDEYSAVPIFQSCPEAGPLVGQPETLFGAAFLTDTSTVYQATPAQASSSPSNLPSQPPPDTTNTPQPTQLETTTADVSTQAITNVPPTTSQPAAPSQENPPPTAKSTSPAQQPPPTSSQGSLSPPIQTSATDSALPLMTNAETPTMLSLNSPIIIASTSLNAGSPTIIVSGTPISLSASNSILVVGGSTLTLPSSPTNQPAQVQSSPLPTATPLLSLAPNSAFIFDDTTLTPGGAPITVSGTPVSLAPSASYILLGTSSIPLTPLEYLTVGTQIFTATQGSDFVLSGQTLVPGGASATVGGTVVSLGSVASQVVVGGSTESVGVGGLIWSGIGGTVATTGGGNSSATGSASEGIQGFTGDGGGKIYGGRKSWGLMMTMMMGFLTFGVLDWDWGWF